MWRRTARASTSVRKARATSPSICARSFEDRHEYRLHRLARKRIGEHNFYEQVFIQREWHKEVKPHKANGLQHLSRNFMKHMWGRKSTERS